MVSAWTSGEGSSTAHLTRLRQNQHSEWNGEGRTSDLQAHGNGSNSDDGAVVKSSLKEDALNPSLSLRGRVKDFGWNWFTMTMALGGISNVLKTVPASLRFRGLTEIGVAIFLINIVLFLLVIITISIRFALWPSQFRASFVQPKESLFVSTAAISLGIILLNITQYGLGDNGIGPWLESTLVVLYWLFYALAVILSVTMYLILWSTQRHEISSMSMNWTFPIYPCLIVGVWAGNLATQESVTPEFRLRIIVSGVIIQGIGFMVSLMIYSVFLYRLMSQKLPSEGVRPAMFVSVGPSGFTISGLINMGQAIPKVIPPDFLIKGQGELVGTISSVLASWAGIWLWGLAFWFFFISVGSHVPFIAKRKAPSYAMSWYSFIFPNTALTTATFAVSEVLSNNRPIAIIGCVLTVGLVIAWLVVFVMMIRAIKNRQILWPQQQDDHISGASEMDQSRSVDPERGLRDGTASARERKRRESG